MDLNIKSIIRKHKADSNVITSDDVISIFDDISSIGLSLHVNGNPELSLLDSMKLLNRIIKEIHNHKLQTLKYNELPTVLKIIESYKHNNERIKGAF